VNSPSPFAAGPAVGAQQVLTPVHVDVGAEHIPVVVLQVSPVGHSAHITPATPHEPFDCSA
jgi:hypothetical protein